MHAGRCDESEETDKLLRGDNAGRAGSPAGLPEQGLPVPLPLPGGNRRQRLLLQLLPQHSPELRVRHRRQPPSLHLQPHRRPLPPSPGAFGTPRARLPGLVSVTTLLRTLRPNRTRTRSMSLCLTQNTNMLDLDTVLGWTIFN